MTATLEDVVLTFPNASWDIPTLSANNGMTSVIFETLGTTNPNWDFGQLSAVMNIDYIFDHPEYAWQYDNVSTYNRGLTITHVLDHPEISWNFSGLSYLLPLQSVLDNPTLDWDFAMLSQHNIDNGTFFMNKLASLQGKSKDKTTTL